MHTINPPTKNYDVLVATHVNGLENPQSTPLSSAAGAELRTEAPSLDGLCTGCRGAGRRPRDRPIFGLRFGETELCGRPKLPGSRGLR